MNTFHGGRDSIELTDSFVNSILGQEPVQPLQSNSESEPDRYLRNLLDGWGFPYLFDRLKSMYIFISIQVATSLIPV